MATGSSSDPFLGQTAPAPCIGVELSQILASDKAILSPIDVAVLERQLEKLLQSVRVVEEKLGKVPSRSVATEIVEGSFESMGSTLSITYDPESGMPPPLHHQHSETFSIEPGSLPPSHWGDLSRSIHSMNSSPGSFIRRATTRRNTIARERIPGLVGAVRAFRVPEENDRDTIFQACRHTGGELFFRHLKFHDDGGLHKLKTTSIAIEAMLSKKSRVGKVFLRLALVVFNAHHICSGWLDSRFWHGKSEASIMLQKRMLNATLPLINPENEDDRKAFFYGWFIVTTIELALFSYMALDTVWVILKYACFTKAEEKKHYRIWYQLYVACSQNVRRMTNYSAMQMLAIFNPQRFRASLMLELTKVEEGANKPFVLISFFVLVIVQLLLGFAAFLTKFAGLAAELNRLGREQWSTHRWYLSSALCGEYCALHGEAAVWGEQLGQILGFLNQVIGITLVWKVNEERLFLFVFGGEDSQMQAGELDRQYAYVASVTEHVCMKLWAHLPPIKRSLKRGVALLTLNDLDFQALLLDEDESLEVDANTLHTARRQTENLVKAQGSAAMERMLSGH